MSDHEFPQHHHSCKRRRHEMKCSFRETRRLRLRHIHPSRPRGYYVPNRMMGALHGLHYHHPRTVQRHLLLPLLQLRVEPHHGLQTYRRHRRPRSRYRHSLPFVPPKCTGRFRDATKILLVSRPHVHHSCILAADHRMRRRHRFDSNQFRVPSTSEFLRSP